MRLAREVRDILLVRGYWSRIGPRNRPVSVGTEYNVATNLRIWRTYSVAQAAETVFVRVPNRRGYGPLLPGRRTSQDPKNGDFREYTEGGRNGGNWTIIVLGGRKSFHWGLP